VQVRGVVALELDSEHGAIHTSFIRSIAEAPKRTPSGEIDVAAEALFAEARRRARRRRRRRAALASLALLGAGAALLVASVGDDSVPRDASERAPVVSPRSVLDGAPTMGVACPVPNSIACDRVAIILSTSRPAQSVSVTVGRRTVVLDDRQWSEPWRHGVKREFSGYLHPAGLRGPGPLGVLVENHHNRWTGVHPVTAAVRVVITYADGSRRATTTRAALSPGWG
jgi:hypothetical protein